MPPAGPQNFCSDSQQARPANSLAYLPLVLAATFVVVVVPLLLVVWLRSAGTVTSWWAGVLVGVVGSLVASGLGAKLWRRTASSGDMLFSDLMLWGWLHRWRSARRVCRATALLAQRGEESDAISGRALTNEQKTSLLAGLIGDLESRDPYTHGHSRRVARHAADIAKQMGLSRAAIAKVRAAGAIHDVGKVHTPPAVLDKRDKLSDEEFEVIKRHPVDGAEMAAVLGDEELVAIVRHHHERVDGKGYPDGLAGAEIPLGARILAVADTFDAITSSRPYRDAHTHDDAMRILAEGAGVHHDPEAVRAFQNHYAGRRPLAIWAIVANAWPRASTAFGSAGTAAPASSVQAVIAAGAVAVGGVAIAPELHSRGVSPEAGVGATPTALSIAGPGSQTRFVRRVGSAPPRAPQSAKGAAAFKRAAEESAAVAAGPKSAAAFKRAATQAVERARATGRAPSGAPLTSPVPPAGSKPITAAAAAKPAPPAASTTSEQAVTTADATGSTRKEIATTPSAVEGSSGAACTTTRRGTSSCDQAKTKRPKKAKKPKKAKRAKAAEQDRAAAHGSEPKGAPKPEREDKPKAGPKSKRDDQPKPSQKPKREGKPKGDPKPARKAAPRPASAEPRDEQNPSDDREVAKQAEKAQRDAAKQAQVALDAASPAEKKADKSAKEPKERSSGPDAPGPLPGEGPKGGKD